MNDKEKFDMPMEQLSQRKSDILDAARRIFARHGFRRTQVEMIADELGIGKGTIYRLFGSKKALFVAIANDSMQRLIMYVEARTEGVDDLVERISTAIPAHLEFFDLNPDIVEILLQERTEFRDEFKPTYIIYRDAYMGHTEEVLKGGVRDGIIRDFDAKRMAVILCDLMYGTVISAYIRGEKDLRDSAGQLVDLLCCGMLTPEAQRRYAEREKTKLLELSKSASSDQTREEGR